MTLLLKEEINKTSINHQHSLVPRAAHFVLFTILIIPTLAAKRGAIVQHQTKPIRLKECRLVAEISKNFEIPPTDFTPYTC